MSQALQVCSLQQMQGHVPSRKMVPRTQRQGTGASLTRSVESAIMAPSLNTASSTISSVGKYLHALCSLRRHAACKVLRRLSTRLCTEHLCAHNGLTGDLPRLGRAGQAHQL